MALDARTSKHSFANALAMAGASAAAYASTGTDEDQFATAIGRDIVDFKRISSPSGEIVVCLAAYEDAIVVAFRGTVSASNWLADGQIALVPFRKAGLIHIGFRNALDSVMAAIETQLAAWSGQGRTLWITGHSLGGALALLSAAYLRFPADPTKVLPRPIAGLYTFGQPRVGTVEFARACDADFGNYNFRYVNNEDIVTRVPPRVLGYWHTDDVVYLDKSGIAHHDPIWWQVFLDQVEAGLGTLRAFQSGAKQIGLVADHGIADYIAAISNNIGQ